MFDGRILTHLYHIKDDMCQYNLKFKVFEETQINEGTTRILIFLMRMSQLLCGSMSLTM